MSEIIGLDNIAAEIKNNLDSGKDVLLYAFNATGKTRLTSFFDNQNLQEDEGKIYTLCYNAIVEDLFSWDNENKIFSFDTNNILFKTIKEEGLDAEVINNFSKLINFNLEPNINTESGDINFCIKTGDDNFKENIKISKGEESLFKWSVFYTVIYHAITLLTEKEENRSLDWFDLLKYCIIDDPVSSIDDYRIYTIVVQILDLLKVIHEKDIKVSFLIETHHVLFYNLVYNTLKNRKEKKVIYLMEKKDSDIIIRELQRDLPIAYHLINLNQIYNSINEGNLQKTHFNMFRSVLEKFAVFLGYNNWQEIFKDFAKKEELSKMINMNSHGKYIELESEQLVSEQEQIFIEGFRFFIKKFDLKI